MTKPVFHMAVRKGETIATSYTPLIYNRGADAWRLALHRELVAAGRGEWIVSDPVSGYRVCRITAIYKGMPVSSCTLNEKQARAAALADLDLLIDRVGLARFTESLTTARKGKTHD